MNSQIPVNSMQSQRILQPGIATAECTAAHTTRAKCTTVTGAQPSMLSPTCTAAWTSSSHLQVTNIPQPTPPVMATPPPRHTPSWQQGAQSSILLSHPLQHGPLPVTKIHPLRPSSCKQVCHQTTSTIQGMREPYHAMGARMRDTGTVQRRL